MDLPPLSGLDMCSDLLPVPQIHSCFAICYPCCSQREPVRRRIRLVSFCSHSFLRSPSPLRSRGPEAAGKHLHPCSRLPSSHPWAFAVLVPHLACCSLEIGTAASFLPSGHSQVSPSGGPPDHPIKQRPLTVCSCGCMKFLSRFKPLRVVRLPTSKGHVPGSRSCVCFPCWAPGPGTVLGRSRARSVCVDGRMDPLAARPGLVWPGGGGGQVLAPGHLSLEWPCRVASNLPGTGRPVDQPRGELGSLATVSCTGREAPRGPGWGWGQWAMMPPDSFCNVQRHFWLSLPAGTCYKHSR